MSDKYWMLMEDHDCGSQGCCHDPKLIGCFRNKPTLQQLAKAMEIEFPNKIDNLTLLVTSTWSGSGQGPFVLTEEIML